MIIDTKLAGAGQIYPLLLGLSLFVSIALVVNGPYNRTGEKVGTVVGTLALASIGVVAAIQAETGIDWLAGIAWAVFCFIGAIVSATTKKEV
jgi:hypothetical protein